MRNPEFQSKMLGLLRPFEERAAARLTQPDFQAKVVLALGDLHSLLGGILAANQEHRARLAAASAPLSPVAPAAPAPVTESPAAAPAPTAPEVGESDSAAAQSPLNQ